MTVEDQIKLIEQASNSILYRRRNLQILKALLKDLKKAKNILKEKTDLFPKKCLKSFWH